MGSPLELMSSSSLTGSVNFRITDATSEATPTCSFGEISREPKFRKTSKWRRRRMVGKYLLSKPIDEEQDVGTSIFFFCFYFYFGSLNNIKKAKHVCNILMAKYSRNAKWYKSEKMGDATQRLPRRPHIKSIMDCFLN